MGHIELGAYLNTRQEKEPEKEVSAEKIFMRKMLTQISITRLMTPELLQSHFVNIGKSVDYIPNEAENEIFDTWIRKYGGLFTDFCNKQEDAGFAERARVMNFKDEDIEVIMAHLIEKAGPLFSEDEVDVFLEKYGSAESQVKH